MAVGNVGSFAAILDRRGRLLIVQERKPPRFGFPGGRVEQGESLEPSSDPRRPGLESISYSSFGDEPVG